MHFGVLKHGRRLLDTLIMDYNPMLIEKRNFILMRNFWTWVSWSRSWITFLWEKSEARSLRVMWRLWYWTMGVWAWCEQRSNCQQVLKRAAAKCKTETAAQTSIQLLKAAPQGTTLSVSSPSLPILIGTCIWCKLSLNTYLVLHLATLLAFYLSVFLNSLPCYLVSPF